MQGHGRGERRYRVIAAAQRQLTSAWAPDRCIHVAQMRCTASLDVQSHSKCQWIRMQAGCVSLTIHGGCVMLASYSTHDRTSHVWPMLCNLLVCLCPEAVACEILQPAVQSTWSMLDVKERQLSFGTCCRHE